MGEIKGYHKKDRLEKKYKDAFSFKELLNDVKEFEDKLAKMKSGLRDLNTEFDSVKKKDSSQTKIKNY